jgi:hypothetical protein
MRFEALALQSCMLQHNGFCAFPTLVYELLAGVEEHRRKKPRSTVAVLGAETLGVPGV